MFKHLVVAVSSAIMMSLVACSASDTPTTGDEQDVKEGHACGGVAGIRCTKGLTCQLAGDSPDAMGKCVKSPAFGTEGGYCGGTAGIVCRAGLECDFSGGPPPGAMGMPVPPGSSGPPPGAMGLPVDRSGTCVKASTAGPQ
jgi:hypothetical protein